MGGTSSSPAPGADGVQCALSVPGVPLAWDGAVGVVGGVVPPFGVAEFGAGGLQLRVQGLELLLPLGFSAALVASF